MKLTDTQLVILSAASQRDDHAIQLAPNLKGGAPNKVVGKLLREGWIEEIQARGSLPSDAVSRVRDHSLCALLRAALPPSRSTRPARKRPSSRLSSLRGLWLLPAARRPGTTLGNDPLNPAIALRSRMG